jgi:hypothetical protein
MILTGETEVLGVKYRAALEGHTSHTDNGSIRTEINLAKPFIYY